MASDKTIERRVYKGNVVTVIGRGTRKGKTQIRDSYGFVHEVGNRELKPLNEDDTRRSYTLKADA